jgi:hypothetical protein
MVPSWPNQLVDGQFVATMVRRYQEAKPVRWNRAQLLRAESEYKSFHRVSQRG